MAMDFIQRYRRTLSLFVLTAASLGYDISILANRPTVLMDWNGLKFTTYELNLLRSRALDIYKSKQCETSEAWLSAMLELLNSKGLLTIQVTSTGHRLKPGA